MKMIAYTSVAALMTLGAVQPVFAQPQSATVRLEARVDAFCRIWTDLGDSAVQAESNVIELGGVRELCNTAGGYVVQAAFTNVRGGALKAGEDDAIISSDGLAVLRYTQAGHKRRDWRIHGAELGEESVPVFMRVTISPL
jgi:hypothetical protein